MGTVSSRFAAVAMAGLCLAPSARAGGLHDGFDALLRAHARDGAVDYAGLKRDEARLDAYLVGLGDTDVDRLDRAERMAFWINAYNALTIKLILRRYPGIRSIKDIPRRWDLADWRVGGRSYSLNEIEHGILRKMGDPRIHFAIVCASKSCPDLAAEAYRPEQLDAQLTTAARRFLADPSKGLSVGMERDWLGRTRPTLRLSPIFAWFEGDFTTAAGRVVDFVLREAPEAARTFIRNHRSDLRVAYLDYDWSLNGR